MPPTATPIPTPFSSVRRWSSPADGSDQPMHASAHRCGRLFPGQLVPEMMPPPHRCTRPQLGVRCSSGPAFQVTRASRLCDSSHPDHARRVVRPKSLAMVYDGELSSTSSATTTGRSFEQFASPQLAVRRGWGPVGPGRLGGQGARPTIRA